MEDPEKFNIKAYNDVDKKIENLQQRRFQKKEEIE
jgi:hypothetical protein